MVEYEMKMIDWESKKKLQDADKKIMEVIAADQNLL